MRTTLALLVALLTPAAGALALPPTISITGDLRDGFVDNLGQTRDVDPRGRAGVGGDIVLPENVVYFFMLPTLLPGEVIDTADLAVNLVDIARSPNYNADLYGLGWVVEPPKVQGNWFFAGTLDTRTGNTLGTHLGTDPVQRLQDNIMVSTGAGAPSNTPVGIVHTNAAGDTQLANFLRSLYAKGAVGGDFVVFRLSPDISNLTTTNPRGYTLDFANGNVPPVLTVTTVPEPSSIALATMAVIGLGLTVARSRRQWFGRFDRDCRYN